MSFPNKPGPQGCNQIPAKMPTIDDLLPMKRAEPPQRQEAADRMLQTLREIDPSDRLETMLLVWRMFIMGEF